MLGVSEAKAGIRKIGNVVTLLVAANAGALVVYQISNLAAQVGTKTFKVKRITILDTTAGGTVVHFGTGAAGAVVDGMPSMVTVAGMPVVQDFGENEGPEFSADLMAWAVAVQVVIQVEVDEIG